MTKNVEDTFFRFEGLGTRGEVCYPSYRATHTRDSAPVSGAFNDSSVGEFASSLSVGTRKFSWPQTLENNQNRIGIVVGPG